MINRLMDLLVFVAEWGRNDASGKDLGEELGRRGYSSDEIEQAVSWVSTRWHRSMSAGASAPSTRVLSPSEAARLEVEAHGYLLRLLNLGLVDRVLFEHIMQSLPLTGSARLGVDDVKALAGRAVFNLGNDVGDDRALQVTDEAIGLT
jgi:Smg protein